MLYRSALQATGWALRKFPVCHFVILADNPFRIWDLVHGIRFRHQSHTAKPCTHCRLCRLKTAWWRTFPMMTKQYISSAMTPHVGHGSSSKFGAGGSVVAVAILLS